MKLIKVILCLFLIPQLMLAGDWDSVFEQANQSYKDGNYVQAAELYESITSAGMDDGKLFFNLGNSYYKSGDFAQAIINYERAKLLIPNDKDVIHNLSIANLLVVDKIEATPEFFLLSWWKNIANRTSVNKWTYLFLATLWIGVILLLGFVFGRGSGIKRLSFFGGFSLLFLALVFILLGLTRQQTTYQHEYAILVAPSVSVKSAPVNSGTDLFIIHEGLKVKIADEEDDWYQIVLADGKEGWVAADAIVRI